jgi:DMSO/TMAO reductase YedYZ molybdopterin-dependent catalytic subunit
MKADQDPQEIPRREFVRTVSGLAAGVMITNLSSPAWAAEAAPANGAAATTAVFPHPFLTPAEKFEDVSRGNPKPFTLKGEALVQARLTPETWRLEINADPAVDDKVKQPASIAKSFTLSEGSALDLPALMEVGKKHEVRFLKAMQCLNIATPLGQGLWEGVPLREVLRLCGKMANVRRIYYSGFHNNDPKQVFQSSLSYTQAMETPPGELPAFLAYRLNGDAIPLVRGGPVRMIIPWAHGFKSIKWLQQIFLTNDYRANDTYALANNDPESHLKSAAYLDAVAEKFPAGQPIFVSGLVISGLSGLKRVEYWLRASDGKPGDIPEDDPAWQAAKWKECKLEDPPPDWSQVLPAGVPAKSVLGFDFQTGQPSSWPLRYSMISWSATLKGLARGKYEVRARAVDLNGDPQPEPRPLQKTGKNPIQVRRFEVV